MIQGSSTSWSHNKGVRGTSGALIMRAFLTFPDRVIWHDQVIDHLGVPRQPCSPKVKFVTC